MLPALILFEVLSSCSILVVASSIAHLDTVKKDAASTEVPNALSDSFWYHYPADFQREDKADSKTGRVILSESSLEFTATVAVGAADLNLILDTGSADLWVFSSELSANEVDGHNTYKASAYSKREEGESWKVTYADGTYASGAVYEDVVGMGGIWAHHQKIQVASNISSGFNKDVDGVLGLGFNRINTIRPTKQKTFFDNVQSRLESPVFALSFDRGVSARFDIGYIDNSSYESPLYYAAVDSSRGRWAVKAAGYIVGDLAMVSTPLVSAVDTGASMMFINDSIAGDYYREVAGARFDSGHDLWSVPCNSSLPSFTIFIESFPAIISGEQLLQDPIARQEGYCVGGIQNNSGADMVVLGHVFLRNHYIVFDTRGPRLGIATQA